MMMMMINSNNKLEMINFQLTNFDHSAVQIIPEHNHILLLSIDFRSPTVNLKMASYLF